MELKKISKYGQFVLIEGNECNKDILIAIPDYSDGCVSLSIVKYEDYAVGIDKLPKHRYFKSKCGKLDDDSLSNYLARYTFWLHTEYENHNFQNANTYMPLCLFNEEKLDDILTALATEKVAHDFDEDNSCIDEYDFDDAPDIDMECQTVVKIENNLLSILMELSKDTELSRLEIYDND